MQQRHRASICFAGILCVACSMPSLAEDSWSYEAIPFLWAAGLDGRVGVNRVVTDVDASFKDLVEFVDIGAALRIAARRPPVGWF